MINDRMEHLDFLKHQVVNAVIFTKDDLQFELEDATITCFTPPLILGLNQDYEPQHADYKNQLVQLVALPILLINESEKGLVISFENKELLFKTEGTREILVVTDGNGEWHSYPDLPAPE